MKTKLIRAASLALGCLMLLALLAGCKKETGEPVQTAPSGDSGKEEQTDGYTPDSLPDDLDFDQTVTMLYWTDTGMPEFDEQLSGDPVNDQIFRRNQAVQERLKVTLDWHGANQEQFAQTVQNDRNSEMDIDIIAGYSQTMATITYTGNTIDLIGVDYLDFTKPWWPDSLLNEAMVGDKLYFISGDISTNTLYWMYATFFNKTMLQTYGLEDPYTLVASNEWTVDKMFSMCKEIYTDAGEPGKDLSDTFGIVMPRLSIDAFFYSSGLRTTDKGENGELLLSPTYTGEVSQSLAEKLVELLFDSEGGFCVHDDTGPVNQAFANGQVAFITNRPMDAITDYGHAKNLLYGVVPTPKWDSQQETYLTCIGNPFTLYSISAAQAGNPDQVNMLGAVLECLGSEAYRKTTPELYYQTMQVRYAKDDVTAQMYDICRETIVFDLGRIFGATMNNLTQTKYRGLIESGSSAWQVTARTFTGQLEVYLELIYDALG